MRSAEIVLLVDNPATTSNYRSAVRKFIRRTQHIRDEVRVLYRALLTPALDVNG